MILATSLQKNWSNVQIHFFYRNEAKKLFWIFCIESKKNRLIENFCQAKIYKQVY